MRIQSWTKLAVLSSLFIILPFTLGGCLKEWDYEEVESWYDPQATTFDENLAAARQMVREGRPDKAENYLKTAIKLVDSQYGPEDLRIATAADELAFLQEQAGKLKEAEASYRTALKARTSLKADNPDLIRNKKALAATLMKLYKAEEAEAILNELKGKSSAKDVKQEPEKNQDSSAHRRKRQIDSD
ncbi:MAG TPA: tetratricopeptide repeat protein [Candidatus Melainabacteria bacterium]|nr:tetratricopeptide repeat protein [Candidatus Melainabacteria bacterium]